MLGEQGIFNNCDKHTQFQIDHRALYACETSTWEVAAEGRFQLYNDFKASPWILSYFKNKQNTSLSHL